MSETEFKLAKVPIVEAVIDIDCDVPPGFNLSAFETAAGDLFREAYPKYRKQLIQKHRIEANTDAPPRMSVRHAIQAFQFLHEDEKQLVQMRAQGFSFNRLAPYSSLDDYLPEFERTWNQFRTLVAPVLIRTVRLRYINLILLPTDAGRANLDHYFKIGPHLPDEAKLTFVGFLNQHLAVEADTGNQVNIILTAQQRQNDKIPIIFDIEVANGKTVEPGNWSCILGEIQSLRGLKNRVFYNTLTEKCLNLFQH